MIISSRMKEESSRAISTLLLNILEDCRNGDVELARNLGLDIEAVRNLDKLKPNQINNLSSRYMRDRCAMDIFKIDTQRISKIIELAAHETKTYELIDRYLLRGACKIMMLELFGMRSTQVANRKKLLNIPTVKGRLSVITEQEERLVYEAWISNKAEIDFRIRLLVTAVDSNIPLSKVYRIVNETLAIEKHQNENSVCA